jgi:hypothetical protein
MSTLGELDAVVVVVGVVVLVVLLVAGSVVTGGVTSHFSLSVEAWKPVGQEDTQVLSWRYHYPRVPVQVMQA